MWTTLLSKGQGSDIYVSHAHAGIFTAVLVAMPVVPRISGGNHVPLSVQLGIPDHCPLLPPDLRRKKMRTQLFHD